MLSVLVTQSCPSLWDLMDCGLLDSSVPGILQARILEWVAIPFSWKSSWSSSRTLVSWIAADFAIWATREALKINVNKNEEIATTEIKKLSWTIDHNIKYIQVGNWTSWECSTRNGCLEMLGAKGLDNQWSLCSLCPAGILGHRMAASVLHLHFSVSLTCLLLTFATFFFFWSYGKTLK